jgi:hypothetical protein
MHGDLSETAYSVLAIQDRLLLPGHCSDPPITMGTPLLAQ